MSSAPISASSPSRPIVAFAGAGSGAASTSAGSSASSSGSCARIIPSSRRSSGPGLEPELVDQEPPALAHHLQRVRLAAGAIEREHQLPAQPLAQRVLGDQRAQLADQVGRLPAASSAASRSSVASSRSSSRRAISLCANSSKRWSASAGPRHSASADASCPAARDRVGALDARALEQRLEAPAVDRLALDLERVARRRGGAPAAPRRAARAGARPASAAPARGRRAPRRPRPPPPARRPTRPPAPAARARRRAAAVWRLRTPRAAWGPRPPAAPAA